MSDINIVGLDKHRAKAGPTDKPPALGHTSDLPIEAVDQDMTVTVSTHHTGHNEQGRPTATYQIAWRLGEHRPPVYRPTGDQVEYMARGLEFAARRLREHYGTVPVTNPPIAPDERLRQPLERP